MPDVDKEKLRDLPSVDQLLRTEAGRAVSESAGPRHASRLAAHIIGELRSEFAHLANISREALLFEAARRMQGSHKAAASAATTRVINATGVIIHTNLGRAPLSTDARAAVAEATQYCTLEYDTITGLRGKRGRHVEDLVCELTGAESALIVNNCAAAAFFVLTVFAANGEVVISRGELVEIGGDFRIPDVLTNSSATLREVGTTNRTKISDYESAIGDATKMILRVHPSNYRIVGFTATPAISELAALAVRKKVLLYEDLGSGALIDLSPYGLEEPTVASSIKQGVDIVSFSGDKLLGGPQSGIIAGKSSLVDQLRKHPLYRALRVDKLAYAALGSTLSSYRRGAAIDDIPVLNMLAQTEHELLTRATHFAGRLSDNALSAQVIDGHSAVGGGSAPAIELKTKLIALEHRERSADDIAHALRQMTPPVITRIFEDKVMIDLRTVPADDEAELMRAVLSLT